LKPFKHDAAKVQKKGANKNPCLVNSQDNENSDLNMTYHFIIQIQVVKNPVKRKLGADQKKVKAHGILLSS
jgi:hypothetical protein